MARTDLDIPDLGSKLVDLRDSLLGDGFNWSWVRDLSQVNYLAIHHSGGPDTQTPQEIADYHINVNGWGGIGYHFLIDKNGVVYYCADIKTARANVANLNEQVIGICLIGSFSEGKEPTALQLDSAHKLCDFLIKYPDLINVKTWDALKGHKELPNQETVCPGDNWFIFKPKIFSGPPASGQVVFNNPGDSEKQIKDLQMSLAYINSQLISCQTSLQQTEARLTLPQKGGDFAEIVRPYLPVLLFAVWTALVFVYNINLLNIFFGIKTDLPFFDMLFSSFLTAWVFILINNLAKNFRR